MNTTNGTTSSASAAPVGSGAALEITENGPIKVSGPVKIVSRRGIRNARGAGIAWEHVGEVPHNEETWLCRCGESANKPFCDGSHRQGFVADDSCPQLYDEGASVVGGVGMVIKDNRHLCMHAKFCFSQEGNVWKKADQTDDDDVRRNVVSMIERCPSGALTVRFEDEADIHELETQPTIAIVDDGPLWVIGSIPITLADGSQLEPRNRVTLCRCGHSDTKPLCDGAHTGAGFADSATAEGADAT